MKNLIKAVLQVMKEVKSIDKSLNVGTGNSSYKGVADKDVKNIIGTSMQKNGLVIFPIDIEETTDVNRWKEDSKWGIKQKQSVFTKVTTTYLLAHESGESVKIKGYGHGVDTQDKGAGKSTTYALKYALLYQFLTPTGHIDDADKEHSDVKDIPQKPVLDVGDGAFEQAKNWIANGGELKKVLEKYDLTDNAKKDLKL